MSCGICGREGDTVYRLKSDRAVGITCGNDKCGALTWEQSVCPGETKDERALLVWRIRKHRAAMNGQPFTEPAPKTDAERFFEKHDELRRIAEAMVEGVL